MFGWPMEEEAKLEFTITVNWRREDGSIETTQLGTVDRGACRSAEDVGLQLADAKPILGRLQEIVVSEQLQRYCEAVRPCPRILTAARGGAGAANGGCCHANFHPGARSTITSDSGGPPVCGFICTVETGKNR